MKKQWIVMAILDNGDEESIGCLFEDIKMCRKFMDTFDEDWNRLDEFMPDSDYREVKNLEIREESV